MIFLHEEPGLSPDERYLAFHQQFAFDGSEYAYFADETVWVYVDSSNVVAVAWGFRARPGWEEVPVYDVVEAADLDHASSGDERILAVRYINRKIPTQPREYHFYGCAYEVYCSMLLAPSSGKFSHVRLKAKYTTRRVA